MSEPLVSICCITYNHEKYIRDCIEGFIMQKVNFPFEILIFDDASTDQTTHIIQEYITNPNNNIIPFFQKENQLCKGIKGYPSFILPHARGKYIALCEGDDYWTDPLKLQKQVDFIQQHKNTSYVFTARKIIYERENKIIIQQHKEKIYTTKDILSGFNPGIQSVLFRMSDLCLDEFKTLNTSINGDRLFPYLLSLKGEIRYLPDITSVYRVTGKGVSTKISKEKWFVHAISDFYRFHSTLGFPDMKCYAKGQANYLLGNLIENKFNFIHFFKTSFSALKLHCPVKKNKRINLIILYYTSIHFLLKINIKIKEQINRIF